MIYTNLDLNNFIDEFFNNNVGPNKRTTLTTRSNDEEYEINYTEDGSYIHFEVPGFDKTNLKIELEKGIISVTGKRTYKMNKVEKTKTISKEFRIGEAHSSEAIEATIENGLLTIFIPNYKKEQKKTINII
jgi:HSP20 family molecular chaperone IbpA